jgi:L-alanine-DL-glutamate epimerase-like enolase superfamily enzyme
MRLTIARHTLSLAQPFHSAGATVNERVLAIVAIADDDGLVGYGEAAPLEPYDGVSFARVWQALHSYTAVLDGARGMNGAQIVDACRRVEDLPAALAAIDMALWDRAGRASGRPLAALITDEPASAVEVNAVLSATDREQAAAQAAHAVEQGFACLKVKVAIGDDAGRLAAVRAAAGNAVAIRIDANGAWDVPHAIRNIEALAPVGLELVEEPTHGLHAVREVREQVAVRVAIDETAAEHGALGAGVADAVCLKISRCGGIAGLLAAATLVRASGAEVYLASTLDGPLGIAAAVHAAAALASRGPVAPCGLATLSLFEDEAVAHELPVRAGHIAVPTGPGLGIEPLSELR